MAQQPALGIPDFRRFIVARVATNSAQLMQSVAIGWQVYDITHDPTDLGLVGLALFLPQVLLALAAGHVADRFDRRRVIQICLGFQTVAALALTGLAAAGIQRVAPILGVLLLFATARAFLGPSMQSLLPLLVPREHLPNAVLWSSSCWQMAVVAGPALGGFLYGFGAETVYATGAGLLMVALLTMALIGRGSPTLRPGTARTGGASWRDVLGGVHFIRARPVLLGAISMDLFAVLFGGATALLPVYARDILLVGPWGLGLLRSAPALGAAGCGLWLAHHPPRGRVGRAMLIAVAGFGLATIGFGLSRSFSLSLAALVAMGGCDMVSVYVRQNLVQLSTPDEMRGRVTAVNQVFIGASNELGEFESGITAGWFGTVPAVVLGGVCTLAVVAVWRWRFPQLAAVDKLG